MSTLHPHLDTGNEDIAASLAPADAVVFWRAALVQADTVSREHAARMVQLTNLGYGL